jgi:hypothetical protein
MELDFTINGSLDPVAAYAALLATFHGIWGIWQWRTRNAVRFRCHPNTQPFPSVDKKIYIDFTNKGQTQTTIMGLHLYHWDKWHHRFFRKKWRKFFVRDGSIPIPCTIQPGAIWQGVIPQEEEFEKMARNGYLYVVVFHSMSNNPVMQRVHLPSTIKNPD